MAYSSSNSDTEDCSSKSTSNLSLSVGHFPCEDTSCEDTTSCEDAPSKGPSIHFLPPIQGRWGTEMIRRPRKRQDQIEDKPEQFCKLSILLAWDVDVGSDNTDSIANSLLNGDNLWINKFPKETTKLSVSKLDNLVQEFQTFLENLKDAEDDDAVFPETTQNDFRLSRGSPLEMAQMISEATASQRTIAPEISSILSEQSEKDDTPSHTRTPCCLGWAFSWLRQHVLSSVLRREHPVKATKRPYRPALRKRCFHRSKRIQPQETLELEHPI
uniref:Chromosome 12 open reading frame 71 n=1 Tax=Saimiri boliviensis boliviensis TaxID=39432 RepID=A0A2K6U6M8_SAIBB